MTTALVIWLVMAGLLLLFNKGAAECSRGLMPSDEAPPERWRTGR